MGIVEVIDLFFRAACRQLWADYVSIPDYHLWALAVMRTPEL